MNKKFSRTWVRSKQPRKQRKYRYNAPNHIRRKMISAHLSPSLRKEYKRRSIPVRKGDEVVVMKGSFKGVQGKITRIDTKKLKIYIENVKRKKTSGQDVEVPIDPSNVKIINLNLEDKKRLKIVKRHSSSISKEKY